MNVGLKKLSEMVRYSNARIDAEDVSLENFITTDNILQNKAGITIATSLPPSENAMPAYEPENILLANIRPYLKKIWFADKHGGCSADVLVFTVKENYVPKFVYYAMFRDDFFHHIMKGAKGTKMPRGDKNQILHFLAPDFDLPTQHRIAAVLSALDAKIDLNKRINAELEALAKTLYDFWFVQFDFPDENGKPYKTSGGAMVWNEELKREIPQGWEVGKLADILSVNPSISLKKGDVSAYLDMDALPTEGFMTKQVQQKAFSGGIKFRNGDVLLARITPCLENGKTGLVTLLPENEVGFGSTEFIVLRGKSTSLSGFAACLSRSALFRKYAVSKMLGTSGRKRVEAKSIEDFQMALPSSETLRNFERIVTPYFQIATAHTKQNFVLNDLRDVLLPLLMNGQVRAGQSGAVFGEPTGEWEAEVLTVTAEEYAGVEVE
jgi:type I restriction enzyme S subunit